MCVNALCFCVACVDLALVADGLFRFDLCHLWSGGGDVGVGFDCKRRRFHSGRRHRYCCCCCRRRRHRIKLLGDVHTHTQTHTRAIMYAKGLFPSFSCSITSLKLMEYSTVSQRHPPPLPLPSRFWSGKREINRIRSECGGWCCCGERSHFSQLLERFLSAFGSIHFLRVMLDESFYLVLSLSSSHKQTHRHTHITCFCTLANLISFALSVHQLHRDSPFTITLHKYSNEMQNLLLSSCRLDCFLFLSLLLLSPSFRLVVIESNSPYSHFFLDRNALVRVCLLSLPLSLDNNCLARSRFFFFLFPPLQHFELSIGKGEREGNEHRIMIVIIMIKDGEGARTCPISLASGLAPRSHQHTVISTCSIIITHTHTHTHTGSALHVSTAPPQHNPLYKYRPATMSTTSGPVFFLYVMRIIWMCYSHDHLNSGTPFLSLSPSFLISSFFWKRINIDKLLECVASGVYRFTRPSVRSGREGRWVGGGGEREQLKFL